MELEDEQELELKQSAGKLMDEGLYGCIFSPPLECKNDKKRTQHTTQGHANDILSKLLLKDNAEIEFSISKIIQQIPLWRNYFVVSESMCEPALTQPDKDLSICPIFDSKGSGRGSGRRTLKDFRILMMPYGGVPLNLYKINVDTFDFLKFVKHFIESVAILNLFGVVHRDIHQANILVDTNVVPRLIDFNLAISIQNKIISSDLAHVYNYAITQEPPDSTLVNAILYGFKPDNIINSIIYKKSIMNKISTLLSISKDAMFSELEEFYNQSKSVGAGDDVTWFKTYWRTIDSWAVAVNIVDLIGKLLLWPEFSKNLRLIKSSLFPVLKRMCAVSPVRRIDCVQALNFLDPNSFIIRKYAKAWLQKVGTGDIASSAP